MITIDYQIIINFQFTLTVSISTISAFVYNNDPETKDDEELETFENMSCRIAGRLRTERQHPGFCPGVAHQVGAYSGRLRSRRRHRRHGPRRGRQARPLA